MALALHKKEQPAPRHHGDPSERAIREQGRCRRRLHGGLWASRSPPTGMPDALRSGGSGRWAAEAREADGPSHQQNSGPARVHDDPATVDAIRGRRAGHGDLGAADINRLGDRKEAGVRTAGIAAPAHAVTATTAALAAFMLPPCA